MTSKRHIGTKKTLEEVGKLYDCLPRSAVDKYVSLCLVCHMRKPQTTRAPLKPLVPSGFIKPQTTRAPLKPLVSSGFRKPQTTRAPLKPLVSSGFRKPQTTRAPLKPLVSSGFRKPQTTRAPLKPLVSSGFMTRGQVCDDIVKLLIQNNYHSLSFRLILST